MHACSFRQTPISPCRQAGQVPVLHTKLTNTTLQHCLHQLMLAAWQRSLNVYWIHKQQPLHVWHNINWNLTKLGVQVVVSVSCAKDIYM